MRYIQRLCYFARGVSQRSPVYSIATRAYSELRPDDDVLVWVVVEPKSASNVRSLLFASEGYLAPRRTAAHLSLDPCASLARVVI